MLLFAFREAQMFSPKPEGLYLLDQASCLALGHGLLILLLGDFILFDIPRVGNAVDGPAGNESWGLRLGQTPLPSPEPAATGHSQGEVCNEGRLG